MLSTDNKEELVNTYKTQGYVKIKNVISLQKIRLLERAIDNIADEFSETGETRDDVGSRLADTGPQALHEFTQILRMVPEFHAIENDLQEIVRNICDAQSTVTIQSNILMGTPQNYTLFDWHQESSYIDGPDRFVNFWFPLFHDSTKTNGAMCLLEGSHVDGTLPYEKICDEQSEGPDIIENIPEQIDSLRRKHRESRSTLSRGDVLAMHPDLIHKSSENQSNHVRFTGAVKIAPVDGIKKYSSDIIDIPH